MSASIGTLGQLGMSASSPVDVRFNYERENLVNNEAFHDGNGLRGTQSRNIDRVRANLQRIGGPVVFQPNPSEMQALLPWILGTPVSTITYALADTMPERYITIDRLGKVFTYDGCKSDVTVFRAEQGGPLTVECNVVAKTETVGNSGTFPSLSISTTGGPWIFSDLALTANSVTCYPKFFELSINRFIDKERYFNSLTLNSVETLDREIMFKTLLPYGDQVALYNTGASGVQVTAVFTNGVYVLTFSMVKVALPRRSPSTPGRVEIMLPLEGIAYKSGSTLELVTTLAVS